MSDFYDLSLQTWSPPGHQGLSVSKVSYTQFEFPRHFHSHYTILLVDQGVNIGFTKNQHYKIGRDTLLIINPGDLHAGKSDKHDLLSFYSLIIQPSYLEYITGINELPIKADPVFSAHPVIDDVHLVSAFRKLIHSIRCNTNNEEIQHRIDNFFIEVLCNRSISVHAKPENSSTKSFLKRAVEFLKENHERSFSLQELARYCHVSPYHLLRQFKQALGMTPFEYLKILRIEKSKTLMKRGGSLTEVALTSGFYDQSHFIRTFKEVYGIRPSAYRSLLS